MNLDAFPCAGAPDFLDWSRQKEPSRSTERERTGHILEMFKHAKHKPTEVNGLRLEMHRWLECLTWDEPSVRYRHIHGEYRQFGGPVPDIYKNNAPLIDAKLRLKWALHVECSDMADMERMIAKRTSMPLQGSATDLNDFLEQWDAANGTNRLVPCKALLDTLYQLPALIESDGRAARRFYMDTMFQLLSESIESYSNPMEYFELPTNESESP